MLDNLLKPENKSQLVSLLKHHAQAIDLDIDALKLKRAATPLEGGVVKVDLVNGELRIGNAHVRKRSFRIANGSVIAIDRVLLP